MNDMDVVELTEDEQCAEWARCVSSPWHFIKTKCHIYQSSERPQEDEDGNNYDPTSSTGGKWVPFELWPSQIQPLSLLHTKRKVILLKARQIGMTWLALAYSLWMLLFMDNVTILLFSRGDREAMDLLRRLIEMFKRLPRWMMPPGSYKDGVDGETLVTGVAGHTWKLPNGSRVMAFPSSAGDSYSATMAVIDEADLVPDLDKLLGSVKPTVDGGGKLVLISRVDKKKPTSPFKRMCRAAMAALNGFAFCFLPWYSDPRRTLAFYKDQVADSMTRTFSMDAVYEQYPACLTAEIRVSTEEGIIPIADALGCKETESGPVVASSIRPVSPIFKMETERGRVIRGTADHPVMTSGGFVHLSKLVAGTEIVLRPPMFAKEIHVESWSPLPGLTASVAVTPEWARFIGFFMGDGSYSSFDALDIACDTKDADVVKDVIALVIHLFGVPHLKHVARIPGRAGCTYVRLSRKEMREPFLKLGLIRSKGEDTGGCIRKVCVPDCIWRSPKPIVREFLRGLFESDGSASGGYVNFSTNKQQFARDVQLLLLGFGINSSIRVMQRKGGDKKHHPLYLLGLNAEQTDLFSREIGFVGARKQTLAESKRNPSVRSTSKRLPNAMTDFVKSVVADGEELTFDFTIGEAHVFSANGILTHNTPEEALAPNQLDKRFPEMALAPCFVDAPDLLKGGTAEVYAEWDNPKHDKNRPESEPNPKFDSAKPENSDNPREILNPKKLRALCPKLNNLRVYVTPKPFRSYTLSVDPAQGLPGSDDSSIVVIDDDTKEECAHLHGKIDPRSIGRQAAELCDWYRKPTGAKCTVVIERNNHGHATIGWWHDNRREGLDASLWLDKDQFPGWVQTGQSKEVMWHRASDAISRKNCIIHSRDLYDQIASIEAATLGAPPGQLDDSAVAWGLCMAVSGMKKKLGWMGLKLPGEEQSAAV